MLNSITLGLVTKRITCILFVLLYKLSFAQNTSIDSLNLLLSKETNTIKKLELFEELVNTASNTDFKIAIVYARLATDLANKTQNKTWQPKFNEMKGRIHANLLELDSASYHFDKAFKGYTEIDDKKGQATTLFKIGWVYKKEAISKVRCKAI